MLPRAERALPFTRRRHIRLLRGRKRRSSGAYGHPFLHHRPPPFRLLIFVWYRFADSSLLLGSSLV